jgi:bleomycin hydrolase
VFIRVSWTFLKVILLCVINLLFIKQLFSKEGKRYLSLNTKCKKMRRGVLFAAALLTAVGMFAQDKATFKNIESKYYNNTIMKGVEQFEEEKVVEPKKLTLAVDHTGKTYPKNPDKYNTVWYQKPISQGNTGTCWCFSTSSFFESEIKRVSGKEADISEMYTVYWEYVERAKYFVANRGEMSLGEGSETNAVAKIMSVYGAVPNSAFTGMKKGQTFHNHEQMFIEIEKYFAGVKESNSWNEEEVVKTVKSILRHYLGPVPTEVIVDGKKMTPQDYLRKHLQLNPDDYVNFMSLMQHEYYKKAVYDVPDNWWRSSDYNNVPLLDFMTIIKESLKGGFSIAIGGDVSEAGFDKEEQVAVIPDFDIASANINESARQMRFTNGATTDDHAMHIVGYQEVKGETWFLIKDSGSGSRNCGPSCDSFGYYFMHEDYIKLKMMTMTVHKDAAKSILSKMK